MIRLMLGDCLERMREIADGSVDAIIADPPYGCTEAGWDTKLDLGRFWEQAGRLLSPGSPVVMFANMRHAVELIGSNPGWFRHDFVWDKVCSTGFTNARRQPLRRHEFVLIFGPKGPRYSPQFWTTDGPRKSGNCGQERASIICRNNRADRTYTDTGRRHPTSIFRHSSRGEERAPDGSFLARAHPTQKPVGLMAYLIRTYTDPGMTVLDPTMGSGSTGVACLETGRSFIGMERDPDYFAVAEGRIAAARAEAEAA